jgi:hypothetical protein
VRHDEAWPRLPDLLDDRDNPALLAHIRSCTVCQRQLFLLGRVDRALRARGATRGIERPRPRSVRRATTFVAVVAAAAAVALGSLLDAHRGPAHELMFRTASGRAVANAVMDHSDARNLSLSLTVRHLPVHGGPIFVLWADARKRTPMQVGHFMVNHTGGCRVRFNLPADQTWSRFWITTPAAPATIVAQT